MLARNRRVRQAGKTQPSVGRSVVAQTADSSAPTHLGHLQLWQFTLCTFDSFVVNSLMRARQICARAMLYSTQ